MPLVNFGAILNFAEELETQALALYRTAIGNPALSEHREIFEQFVIDAEKNMKTIQRVRRENVTEMILEGVKGLRREPFLVGDLNGEAMDSKDLLDTTRNLEERARRYYQEAADRMKALPEVARALKMVGKKHAAHFNKINELGT